MPRPGSLEAPRPRAGGWTLTEALVVVTLAGVLAGLGAPSFRTFLLDARRTERVHAFLHTLHAARVAAIQRAQPVAVCASADGRQCSGTGRWSEGWIVFVNRDRDMPARVDEDEPVLRVEGASPELQVSSSRSALVYWPVSLAGTTATVLFCDERGSAAARAIIVSQTGRPRVSQRDSSGRLLHCP